MPFEFNSNPLNDYASYTYNFKLYAVTQKDHNEVVRQTDLDSIHKRKFKKKVILAETGSTTMSISDMSITSFPSTTEGSYYNQFNLSITQVKGYSLMESIVMASGLCEWYNLVQDPTFLLEISFKGIRDNGSDFTIDDTIYTVTFPLKFTKINTEVTNKGTRYNITAVLNFDSLRSDISSIPEAFAISDITTVDTFLDKFEKELNRIMKEDVMGDKGNNKKVIQQHRHTFRLGANARKLFDDNKITLSNPIKAESPVYSFSMNQDEGNGNTYKFNANDSIPKIIEGVFSANKKIQQLIKGEDKDGNITGYGITFTIEPVIEYGDLIPEIGKHVLDITWYIKTKKVVIPTNNTIEEGKYLRYLVSNGALNKRYDYYFTGLNTEVLEANIEMGDVYFNKLAKYNNLFLNSSNSNNQTNTGSTSTDQENKFKNEIGNLKQNTNSNEAEPTNIEDDQEVIYIDDISSNDLTKLYRMKNKFQKEYTGSTASESPTPEEGGDSKRREFTLNLLNIRNNLEHSMMNLDLEIRGDPYWLIPANSIYKGKNSRSSTKFNLIAFFMGYPNEVQERQNINKTSNLPFAQDVRTDYMFSGLYNVVSITSTFNGGKFTQKMKCVRIVDIRGYTLENELRKDNLNTIKKQSDDDEED